MQALYCEVYEKWHNEVLESEKATCKASFDLTCIECGCCVWKEIEEDNDE